MTDLQTACKKLIEHVTGHSLDAFNEREAVISVDKALDGQWQRNFCQLLGNVHDVMLLEQLGADESSLLTALENLLAYSNRYSDEMAKKGMGAEELGELADSISVAGLARAAIQKAKS